MFRFASTVGFVMLWNSFFVFHPRELFVAPAPAFRPETAAVRAYDVQANFGMRTIDMPDGFYDAGMVWNEQVGNAATTPDPWLPLEVYWYIGVSFWVVLGLGLGLYLAVRPYKPLLEAATMDLKPFIRSEVAVAGASNLCYSQNDGWLCAEDSCELVACQEDWAELCVA
jgi:hypothetical protein